MDEELETKPAVFIDLLALPLAFLGSLISIGALTLHQSHTIALVIGLLFLVLSKAGIPSWKITFDGVTAGSVAVWSLLFLGLGVFQLVAAIHAIVELLSLSL